MLEFGVLIAVLVGVAQVLKKVGLPAKYLPLFNLVAGALIGIVTAETGTIYEKIIFGAVVGLSASGLFDQTKIMQKK